jgi:hypothetical protein
MVQPRAAPRRGDILIIASFATYTEIELAKHAPQLIYVDTQNRIVRIAGQDPDPGCRLSSNTQPAPKSRDTWSRLFRGALADGSAN